MAVKLDTYYKKLKVGDIAMQKTLLAVLKKTNRIKGYDDFGGIEPFVRYVSDADGNIKKMMCFFNYSELAEGEKGTEENPMTMEEYRKIPPILVYEGAKFGVAWKNGNPYLMFLGMSMAAR